MKDKRACIIVEDEHPTAEALAIQLQSLGVAVLAHVETVSDAINKALELRPDLIFMDVRLGPGADGLFASFAIGKELESRIIFITGSAQAERLDRIYADKPVGIVSKPFTLDDLRKALAAENDAASDRSLP